VFTLAFAAVSSAEVVLFGENEVAFFVEIIFIRCEAGMALADWAVCW